MIFMRLPYHIDALPDGTPRIREDGGDALAG
jgi:hypothetical protein